MAKGYLTAAEYKLIRQSLGLTQEQAAEFHKVKNRRTIVRWEKGDSFISDIACDKILNLAEKVDWTVSQAVELARSADPKETEITLIIYPDSCFKNYAIGFEDLPNSVHQAMIARIYNTLKSLGYKAGVVEFNEQAYLSFLNSHGLTDTQDARAAWAAEYRQKILN